jgi:hypothetical protein
MKEYKFVSKESSHKLLEAFSSTDEMDEFMHNFSMFVKEQFWMHSTAERASVDDAVTMFLSQLSLFTIFCRQNIELIKELVARLEVQNMTEEQIEELKRRQEEDG